MNEVRIVQIGNELLFKNLSDPRTVDDFVEILNKSLGTYQNQFILNFKDVESAYPNVCVPIAGIVENLSHKGFQFEFYYFLKS